MTATTTPTHHIITCDTREEWRAQRLKLLTASDLAGICGDFPWTSPERIAAEKQSGKDDFDQRLDWGKRPLYWGSRREREVLEAAAELLRAKLVPWPQLHLAVSVAHPWLACTPDAFLDWGDGVVTLLEAKCSRSQAMWERGLPEYHSWQVQAQLLVMPERRFAHLVCLLCGDELLKFGPIDPDPVKQRVIVEKGRAFWERCVRDGLPPLKPEKARVEDVPF